MNVLTLQRHRDKLLELKAEILAAGDIAPESAREDPEAVGSDEDTQPLAEMAQSIASSRNRNRSGVLARVLAALARIEEAPESFGLCAECDEPIAPKRLELMPYVELCVECQQLKDGPRQTAGRKHLRDFR